MRWFIILLVISCLPASSVHAQDNVAEIAHSFIKAVKANDLNVIKSRYLNVNAAYPLLPEESVGMNAREKNNKYIKPMYKKFEENFQLIQQQIKDKEINVRKIDLVSYKMGNKESQEQIQPVAMSLFFNYNKKEHILPISVVEIDEHWYILEILNTADLFK